jgi:hypothetical protein
MSTSIKSSALWAELVPARRSETNRREGIGLKFMTPLIIGLWGNIYRSAEKTVEGSP